MTLRRRILLLGVVAVAGMVFALWLQYRSYSGQVRAMEAIKRNVHAVAALSAAVHELQKERGLTAIAGRANDAEPLRRQMRDSDGALDRLAAVGVDFGERRASLSYLRSAVAADAMAPLAIRDGYSGLLRSLIDEMTRLTHEPEAAVAKTDISAHAHLVAAKEYLGQIRATLGNWIEHRCDARVAFENLMRLKGIHEEELRRFGLQAAPELQRILAARFAGDEVDHMRHTLLRLMAAGNPPPELRAADWFTLATGAVDRLKAVEEESLRLIEAKAENGLLALRQGMHLGVLATLGFAAVIFLLGSSATISLLREIGRATVSIERISASRDFSDRIPAEGSSEIGRISRSFNALLDIAEQLLREKEHLANTDMLTGIHNRLRFVQTLRDEAERKRRNNTPMALVLFDIDHFKRINDLHGHNAGDDVLRHLAKVVVGEIRATDVFARWGGEEFVLLMRDDDCDGAMAVAEKMRSAIEATEFPGVGNITCSFGVACWKPGDAESDFIARADKGLYESKRRGRNRVTCGTTGSGECPGPGVCRR